MTTNNSPLNALFATLAKSIETGSKARVVSDSSYGAAATTMLALLAETHGDNDEYTNVMRHVSGIHTNAKEQPEAFAASWAFWRDTLGIAFSTETAKDEPDELQRGTHNNAAKAAIRILRFACSVAYYVNRVGVGFGQFSSTKSKETMAVTIEGAKLLFPERVKSLDGNDYPFVILASARGSWRYQALESLGNAAMVHYGIRKPPRPQVTAPHKPVVDQAKELSTLIDDADAKSIDRPADQNSVLELMLTCINSLNDATLRGFRFTNQDVTEMTAIVDRAKARVPAAKIEKAA